MPRSRKSTKAGAIAAIDVVTTALCDLPRLVYIGDVPVAKTMSGSLLLWRLLETYPADSLLVLETLVSPPATRLPGVDYRRIFPVLTRLAHTRFWPVVNPFLIASARLQALRLTPMVKRFKAQAILTVTHRISWLTAAAVASHLRLPLYLVNHDCWFETIDIGKVLSPWLSRQFGGVYRQAAERFCVSPEMASYYEAQYSARGATLFPGRAADCPAFEDVPHGGDVRPFTLAYAGGVFWDHASLLRAVAGILREIGGQLLIFSKLPAGFAERHGLIQDNIVLRGFVPSNELLGVLRNEADALLVMRDRSMGMNALISFPSKIVDYTATGLAMLLYAPLQSAAATWAVRNQGVALVIEEGNLEGLREAILKLARDEQMRARLGKAALVRGNACFSHRAITGQFLSVLATDAV